MNWFWIALSGPALWGVSNFIDKYLLSRYFKNRNSSSLIIFSSLMGFLVLPIVWLVEPGVFSVSLKNILFLIVSGVLFSMYLFPYFYALSKGDASIVVPIYQIIPVFSFILAYFFLGETLTQKQILSGLIIIIGAIGLSMEMGKGIRLKAEVFWPMILASLLISVAWLIFKFVAIKESYWTATFWEHIGLLGFGLLLLFFVKSYRRDFIAVLKESRKAFVGVNIVNETVNLSAGLFVTYASLLAPLALVQTVNGFQPFFVFIYGVILTKTFPGLVKEDISNRTLIQKITFIVIIFLGTYLLHS